MAGAYLGVTCLQCSRLRLCSWCRDAAMRTAAASVSRSQPLTLRCSRLRAAMPLHSALMPASVMRSQPFRLKTCKEDSLFRFVFAGTSSEVLLALYTSERIPASDLLCQTLSVRRHDSTYLLPIHPLCAHIIQQSMLCGTLACMTMRRAQPEACSCQPWHTC